MKRFIVTTVCLTLVIINGSHGRPQILNSSDGDLSKEELPEDSYFPRDAAGNVVMPDPSRARYAGSEGFQVSTILKSASGKAISLKLEDSLPVILMAPAFPSEQDGEISEPSYGDNVPGMWIDDGSQNFQTYSSQSEAVNEKETSGADQPSGKPIGIESYNDQPNMEYQNNADQPSGKPIGIEIESYNDQAIMETQNNADQPSGKPIGIESYNDQPNMEYQNNADLPSGKSIGIEIESYNDQPIMETQNNGDQPSGKPIGIESYNDQPNMEYQNQNINTRGTLLGRNLRALNEILHSESARKARASNFDDDSIEGVGIYKSMVFFNHLPKEVLNFP